VDFKVKGTHIAECRDYVDERLGGGAYAGYWKKTGAVLSSLVLPSALFEVATADAALREFCLRTGDDYIATQAAICARNAEHDLTTVHRVFMRLAQPKRIVSAVPQLWRNYVTAADGKALTNEDGRAQLECSGVPVPFTDWVIGCWLGFIPSAVRMAGGIDPKLKLTRKERTSETTQRVEFALEYRV
jgi:hypothetical protein